MPPPSFHTMTAPHAASTRIKTLAARSLSSLRDALTNRSHSRDFAYARGDYLRNRVMVVCALFLALLPFWSVIDWFMLAPQSLTYTLPGRAVMLLVLILVFVLARYSRFRPQLARLAAGLLLSAPAAFYALVLATLPEQQQSLIGYSFIPYMLVTMLAIFPFTLFESSVLGAALIALQLYALYVTGDLMTASGLQEIWLLTALLSITLTANYFQLGLLLRLYREATHDPLTGLLNRGALIRTANQAMLRQPVPRMALIMMDLDHFKRINDTYGHAFGDDVLRNFARILQQTLGPGDIASRYGGEEFVAILIDADRATAMEVAERIREQTEAAALTSHEGESVRHTVSIGVAAIKPGESFREAALRADHRLYEAKRISRNRVVGVDTASAD